MEINGHKIKSHKVKYTPSAEQVKGVLNGLARDLIVAEYEGKLVRVLEIQQDIQDYNE